MSSETSTRSAAEAARYDGDHLQPWQLFTLAGLAGATAVVFVTRDAGPAGVILLSFTVGAAAWVGHAAWRALAPLAGVYYRAGATVLGGRTRAALERDKWLVLRAIKDLEFDRAMGKVSEADFQELIPRLRARATRLIRDLDRAGGYREEIEKEIARRVSAPAPAPAAPAASGLRCACGTANDVDARFCKACGSKLEAA